MLVMKFGGASVATPESFLEIAKIIIERSKLDPQIVVVVSAMANMTDHLFGLASKVHLNPPKRELDMLVSVGERISISLLAMALESLGKSAVSFTGSQSGIITCENHSDAKIVEVRPRRVLEALGKGRIAIVAGFQGVSTKGEITTLGRGGSDTSAVALAVGIGAKRVEFYKDAPGVCETDPKIQADAKVFPKLSYGEALVLAVKGAKVLHPRCIQLAEKNRVELCVHSLANPQSAATVVGFEKNQGEELPNCYEVMQCSQG